MELSEEHQAYQSEVARFMRDVVRPLSDRYPYDEHLTSAQIAEMASELAPYEIAVVEPTREDGTPDVVAGSLFIEELAKVDSSLTAFLAMLFFPVLPMPRILSPEQQEAYGHLFRRGSWVAAGFSEPGTGSDLSGLQTTARRVGDEWVINGRKLWVTGADISSAILVAARVPEEDGQISVFLVERSVYDYECRPVPMLGFRRVSECEVILDECRVPDTARVGGPGEGMRRISKVTSRARLNVAFTSMGMAQAALDQTLGYVQEREQFGRKLAQFQLVQAMVVDMAMDVVAGRMMALRAARALDRGEQARVELGMAKVWCTEMAIRVTSQAIQAHGAMGLSVETGLERHFRDARVMTIPDGTSEVLKLLIGRELLGVSALR